MKENFYQENKKSIVSNLPLVVGILVFYLCMAASTNLPAQTTLNKEAAANQFRFQVLRIQSKKP